MEIYGSWYPHNDSLVDLRDTLITSRRRRNINGTILNASMVILHPDTINHLDDYAFALSKITFRKVLNTNSLPETNKLIQLQKSTTNSQTT